MHIREQGGAALRALVAETTGCSKNSASPTRRNTGSTAVLRPARTVFGGQLCVGSGAAHAGPRPHRVGLIGMLRGSEISRNYTVESCGG